MKRFLLFLAFLLSASTALAIRQTGSLPSFNFPADSGKSVVVGPSGAYVVQFAGTAKNVVDYGADSTCTTDVSSIVNTLITGMSAAGVSTGGEIVFPFGCYRVSNTIRVSRNVWIHGVGGGELRTGTKIVPDAGVTAFQVEGPFTSADGGAGDMARISDLDIEYAAGGISPWAPSKAFSTGAFAYSVKNVAHGRVFKATTGGTTSGTEPAWSSAAEAATFVDGGVTWTATVVAGIRLLARAKIERVTVNYAPGDAVHIEANTGAAGPTGTPRASSNANGFHASDLQLYNAYGDGLFVQGTDANAGYAETIDLQSNRLAGVYDNSFLGNTHVAHQSAGNGGGACTPCALNADCVSISASSTCPVGAGQQYCNACAVDHVGYNLANANATNALVNAYAEGGDITRVVGASIVIGGQAPSGITSDSTGIVWRGNTVQNLWTHTNPASTAGVFVQIPYVSNYAINYTDSTEGSVGFTLGSGTLDSGWWTWRHANSDSRKVMSWSGSAADVGPGYAWFPRGVFFGSSKVLLDVGTSKPSTSTWVLPKYSNGAFMLNTFLTAQSPFLHGVFGWQEINQQNSPGPSTVQTLRWPHFGYANEFDLTTYPVGSPLSFDYTEHAGVTFTNVGATGKQYVTLPASNGVPDLRMIEFTAYAANTNGIRFTASGGLSFNVAGTSTAANGYLESTTAGSTLRVKLMGSSSAPQWQVISYSGAWTDGASVSIDSGNFVKKTGDTMSGTLVAASGITVATGALSFTNATNSANAIIVPTGQANALNIKDAAGVIYETVSTSGNAVSFPRLLSYSGGISGFGVLQLVESGATNYIQAPTGLASPFYIGDASGAQYMTLNTSSPAVTIGQTCNMSSNVYMNGGQINWRGANLQNVLNAPTGLGQGLLINDTAGNWYEYWDTSAKKVNSVVGHIFQAGVTIQAASTGFQYLSPQTTKGDLIGFTTVPARVAVGTTGQVLQSDPTNAAGVSWTTDLLGVNTNSSAAVGYKGEWCQIYRGHSAQLALANSTPANIGNGTVSCTLTAGDWEVRGAVNFSATNATTTFQDLNAGISAASGSLPSANTIGSPIAGEYRTRFGSGNAANTTPGNATNNDYTLPIPAYRISIANGATQTLYLVGFATFATSTLAANGWAEFRRIR